MNCLDLKTLCRWDKDLATSEFIRFIRLFWVCGYGMPYSNGYKSLLIDEFVLNELRTRERIESRNKRILKLLETSWNIWWVFFTKTTQIIKFNTQQIFQKNCCSLFNSLRQTTLTSQRTLVLTNKNPDAIFSYTIKPIKWILKRRSYKLLIYVFITQNTACFVSKFETYSGVL